MTLQTAAKIQQCIENIKEDLQADFVSVPMDSVNLSIDGSFSFDIHVRDCRLDCDEEFNWKKK